MSQTGHCRRRHPILRAGRIQLLYAVLIGAYLTVYTLVLSAAALAPTLVRLSGDASNATIADASQLFMFEQRIWPFAAVLILVCALHSITMSHKVFGPLVRVRAEAARIGTGDFTGRIRFRDGDYLPETRDALNAMIDELDTRMGRVHVARAMCRELLGEIDRRKMPSAQVNERLDALKQAYGELESRLEPFRSNHGPSVYELPASGAEQEPGDVPRAA